jgi:hypothetical protein
MTDFKVMFPDMDAEVIEAVLRANNGAVDATIDHLLAMTADNEAEKVMHGEEAGGAPVRSKDRPPTYPPANPPSYQQATRDDEDEEDLINLSGSVGAAAIGIPPAPRADPLPAKDFNLFGSDIFDPLGSPSAEAAAVAASPPISLPPPPPSSSRPSAAASSGGGEGGGNGSPRQGHAYSHPQREVEQDDVHHLEEVDRSHSIVPTQRMLQDKYEQNLR